MGDHSAGGSCRDQYPAMLDRPGVIPNGLAVPIDQVLLYLEQRLAEPMTIFIKCPAGRSDMIMERVEEATTIDEVMDIMVSLQVVAAWAESADVVVRLPCAAGLPSPPLFFVAKYMTMPPNTRILHLVGTQLDEDGDYT